MIRFVQCTSECLCYGEPYNIFISYMPFKDWIDMIIAMEVNMPAKDPQSDDENLNVEKPAFMV